MTDEEADALDELWTRTTPEIDTGKPGFLTRKGFIMVSLDDKKIEPINNKEI